MAALNVIALTRRPIIVTLFDTGAE